FDDATFALLKDTYQQIEELGGDPGAILRINSTNQIELCQELVLPDPPVNVIQAFKITPQLWTTLKEAQQQKLKEVADAYLSAAIDFNLINLIAVIAVTLKDGKDPQSKI